MKARAGFTIVELLIVIVVIAILAAISVVAYTGIQERARASAITSSLTQTAKNIAVWHTENSEQYPSSLADIGIADTETTTYQYAYDNSAQSYCITATANTVSYYISNTNTAQQGVCSGYNVLAWNKLIPSTMPIPLATIDASQFRTSTASMRIGPGQTVRNFRGNPRGGAVGQVYTVRIWVKSDANWDGTSDNSKIRFGNTSTNALLGACGYGGVKVSWTQVSCSFTLTSDNPAVNISVGNNGTIGNIWIDDVSVTLN